MNFRTTAGDGKNDEINVSKGRKRVKNSMSFTGMIPYIFIVFINYTSYCALYVDFFIISFVKFLVRSLSQIHTHGWAEIEGQTGYILKLPFSRMEIFHIYPK